MQYAPASRWYEPDLEDEDFCSTELPVYVPDRDPGPDPDEDLSDYPSDADEEPIAVRTGVPTRAELRGPRAHRPPASGRSLLGLKLVVAAMAVALLGASGGLIVAWVGAPEPPEPSAIQPEDITVLTAEDTYFVDREPKADHSTAPELLVDNRPDRHAIAYLKFDVAPLPRPGRITAVRLETRSGTTQSVGIQLLRVVDTTWVASQLKESGPPMLDKRSVATGSTAAGSTSLSFDVTKAVTASGTYAFALDVASGTTGSARFFASEHGDGGPRLIVTWTPLAPGESPPQGMLRQGGEARPGPQVTAVPSANASFGSPPAKPAGSRTLAGAAIQLRTGETYAQGLARIDRTYGPLKMARVFYPGLPPAWPGSPADVANRTVVVSFKALPLDIIAGRHDAQLASWFASMPRTRDTYWVYYHEPEDNIRDGTFTAADYRTAWRRLAGLADRAGNSRLRATLVLMCWTLDPLASRNWRDYYPGGDVIDVLGWDCYNDGPVKGAYNSPDGLFAKSIEVSRAAGKPFGYAEIGSLLLDTTGSGRAAWLRSVASYLRQHNALWVAYFDYPMKGDWRLLDQPSQQAWQEVCRS